MRARLSGGMCEDVPARRSLRRWQLWESERARSGHRPSPNQQPTLGQWLDDEEDVRPDIVDRSSGREG